jgi:hypothetical protein
VKTRQVLLCTYIFFSSSLYAAPNMIKAVKNEFVSFTEHAQSMLCDYQNGKPFKSLVAHYLDEQNYINAKLFLSTEQHARILKSAELFDQAVQASDRLLIHSCFTNFCNELMNVRQAVCNVTVAAARTAPKQAYNIVAKNSVPETPKYTSVHRNPVNTNDIDAMFPDLLRNMSEGDQKQFNQVMEALANPEASVFDLLLENKGKIAMGLVTLYALFAKAHDWPPYDKKPKPAKVTWRTWLADQATQVSDTVCMMGG